MKDKITNNAKEMYNSFRFGYFNYGKKRINTEPLLEIFLNRISNGSTKLFDIGCGRGFWIDTYIEKGVSKNNIYLMDLAPDNAGELLNKGYNALNGSAVNIPFRNNVSEATICNGVIHHTRDPFEAFKELVRITKKGRLLYLNVYNFWNPYFYIVHKFTFPIRYIYWNISKKILDIIYPISKPFFQFFAHLVFGQYLDEKTGKTMFMDQVMTPRADLFTKAKIKRYCKRCNCKVEQFSYNKSFMMLSAIIKKLD